MTINMQKLHKTSYDEIDAYCQQLAWRGLAYQGQPNMYPHDLSSTVRAIITLVSQLAVEKEKKRKRIGGG